MPRKESPRDTGFVSYHPETRRTSPLREGDRVRIEGQHGYVVEIGIESSYTMLETLRRKGDPFMAAIRIVQPNSHGIDSQVTHHWVIDSVTEQGSLIAPTFDSPSGGDSGEIVKSQPGLATFSSPAKTEIVLQDGSRILHRVHKPS